MLGPPRLSGRLRPRPAFSRFRSAAGSGTMSPMPDPHARLSPRPPADPDAPASDPRRLRVHRPPAPRDVPYVPTDDAVVPAIHRLANPTASDVIYDLGCGDGRILIAAAKRFGASGVGMDIDPLRIEECRENA